VRWEIAQGFSYLGVELDPGRNDGAAPIVSTDGSRVLVRVIAAQENLMVARHTYATLFKSSTV
jgi:acetate kinase